MGGVHTSVRAGERHGGGTGLRRLHTHLGHRTETAAADTESPTVMEGLASILDTFSYPRYVPPLPLLPSSTSPRPSSASHALSSSFGYGRMEGNASRRGVPMSGSHCSLGASFDAASAAMGPPPLTSAPFLPPTAAAKLAAFASWLSTNAARSSAGQRARLGDAYLRLSPDASPDAAFFCGSSNEQASAWRARQRLGDTFLHDLRSTLRQGGYHETLSLSTSFSASSFRGLLGGKGSHEKRRRSEVERMLSAAQEPFVLQKEIEMVSPDMPISMERMDERPLPSFTHPDADMDLEMGLGAPTMNATADQRSDADGPPGSEKNQREHSQDYQRWRNRQFRRLQRQLALHRTSAVTLTADIKPFDAVRVFVFDPSNRRFLRGVSSSTSLDSLGTSSATMDASEQVFRGASEVAGKGCGTAIRSIEDLHSLSFHHLHGDSDLFSAHFHRGVLSLLHSRAAAHTGEGEERGTNRGSVLAFVSSSLDAYHQSSRSRSHSYARRERKGESYNYYSEYEEKRLRRGQEPCCRLECVKLQMSE